MENDVSPRQSSHTDDYNAHIAKLQLVHPELMILRVVPDDEMSAFDAGQYTVLGLGEWERRIDDVAIARASERLIRRAYSISCPMLSESGVLQTVDESEFLEFYITLVTRASDDPPMLTPRLFALREGDRLFLGPRPHGHYRLEHVADDDDVVFLATGTGESPHNAMIAELLKREHRGAILCATCVRYREDLGYLATHEELVWRYQNYQYVPLTTREPENVDESHANYTGKRYLQDFFADGSADRVLGRPLDTKRTHVYLCGNPAMIGLPQRHEDGAWTFPESRGMAEILIERGFVLDQPHQPGNIHYEKYW